MEEKKDICCPKFQPELWDNRTITWDNKLFVKDNIRCFMHVPLNMGKVMGDMCDKIEKAGAGLQNEDFILLSDDVSLWKSVQYIAVSKEVEGMETERLSGTYMTKVFEGPYKNAGKWYKEMEEYVKSQGKEVKKTYFYYTTCPKCAKEHGKNYVVAVAQV